MFEITNLTVELQHNPLGLDMDHPRFSYVLKADGQGVLQEAYRIQVIEGDVCKETPLTLWDSKRRERSQSVHIQYDGKALKAKKAYSVKVEVWNNRGERAESMTTWETGLMNRDWTGKWITYDYEERETYNPAPCLRRDFFLEAGIVRARLYITARGLYKFHINGHPIGEDCFTPGCTDYRNRIQYQVYDISSTLKEGSNGMGALLGDGWYRGDYAKHGDVYGEKLALLMELDVEYRDGTRVTLGSDSHFKAFPSHILKSDFYKGEVQDTTRYNSRWSCSGFDDNNWYDTVEEDYGYKEVVCSLAPMVGREEIINPIEIITTPRGETVLDMGQNMVGWVQITLKGTRNQEVILHHGEVLDQEGNFFIENLRKADQEVRYILNGEEQVLEPVFSFQGFRFVRISGWDDISPNRVKGIVLYSSMEATGEFSCSHPLVNQLQKNIQWGMKGNFVDIPTDCPQRDERLGWTGDAQAFIGTACFNRNVDRFFTKWLADLESEQAENGSIPFIVPNVIKDFIGLGVLGGSTGWGDAALICPFTLYLNYGDLGLLEKQYSSMKKWVDYCLTRLDDDMIWRKDFHFGDWLAKDWIQDFETPYGATTPHLVSTAFLANSLKLLIESAQALRYGDDIYYGEKYKALRRAFQQEFVSPSGRIGSDTQTSYILALHFHLLEEEMIPLALERLVLDIRSRGNHLSTGFLGTPYICHVLTDNGRNDVAYDLLLQESYPSWLYPVTKGATTIWERWDGIKEDESFVSKKMNSFNHYAYGAVGEWLYTKVAGLNADRKEPGFKHFFIRPRPDKRLDHIKLTYKSLYGEIHIEWKIEKDIFQITITVPTNTWATYGDPYTGEEKKLLPGEYFFESRIPFPDLL